MFSLSRDCLPRCGTLDSLPSVWPLWNRKAPVPVTESRQLGFRDSPLLHRIPLGVRALTLCLLIAAVVPAVPYYSYGFESWDDGSFGGMQMSLSSIRCVESRVVTCLDGTSWTSIKDSNIAHLHWAILALECVALGACGVAFGFGFRFERLLRTKNNSPKVRRIFLWSDGVSFFALLSTVVYAADLPSKFWANLRNNGVSPEEVRARFPYAKSFSGSQDDKLTRALLRWGGHVGFFFNAAAIPLAAICIAVLCLARPGGSSEQNPLLSGAGAAQPPTAAVVAVTVVSRSAAT